MQRTILVGLLSILASACFALDPVGAPFIKTNPEMAFLEFKVVGKDGSTLRQPVEDWAGAKQRISQDANWQQWLKNTQRELDDWMTKRQDRTEWIAGWWHDFVSPKNGSFLTWTSEPPGAETLSSPSDPKVALTPKIMGGWVFGFRSRHASHMQDAAMLYRLTGERRYAEWAAGQLDFYATNYMKWPLQTSKVKARIMHQSLDEAVNLIRYVNAAHHLESFVTPERKALWIEKLFIPDANLLQETFHSVHNIACWHRSAEGHVALYTKNEAIWKQAVDGPFGIRNQVLNGVTTDYLWFEQSLGYNSYVVSALQSFFTYASLEGRGADLKTEMAAVENLMLSPAAIRFPNGQTPYPADATGGAGQAPNKPTLAATYRIFPTAIGLATAVTEKNWATLLDPPMPPAVMPPLPEVKSQHLNASRMAVLRQGPWQVYLHYGQIHSSHSQSEALNFEAFYNTTDITHDPGTVGYGSPMHRGYYTTGLAHNVPLMDGLGQASWQPGECLAFEPDKGHITARQPKYRKDVSAERDIQIKGSTLMDTVRIEMKDASNTPHKPGLAVHLQGKASLPSGFKPDATLSNTNQPSGFAYWRNVRSLSVNTTVSLEARYGDLPMRITLTCNSPFKLYHADAPDTPPRRREVLYLETSGTQAVFTTIFEPIRDK